MAEYWELLRDPRWQKMRLEVMKREDFSCEVCGSTTNTLNVHHSYYEKGKMPWEYPSESLHCVCDGKCHADTQSMQNFLKRLIGEMDLFDQEALIGFLIAKKYSSYPRKDSILSLCPEMAVGIAEYWDIEAEAVIANTKDKYVNIGVLSDLSEASQLAREAMFQG